MGEFFAGIFATIGAIFVFGTLTFWIASAVLFSFLIWFTEDDKDFLAFVCIVGFMWVASSVNEFSIITNPLIWLKWLAIYIVTGCAWSFIKWFSFLYRAKDRLRNIKAKFLKRYDVETIDDELFPKFAERLYDDGYVNEFLCGEHNYGDKETVKKRADVIPSVKERFGDLVRWIVWWPMSAFWTILNDPIRRIAEAIVRSLRGAYTRVANAVFSSEL